MTRLEKRLQSLSIRQHRRMMQYDALRPTDRDKAFRHLQIATRLKRKRDAVRDKMRLRGED